MLTNIRHPPLAFHSSIEKGSRPLEPPDIKAQVLRPITRLPPHPQNHVNMIRHNHILPQLQRRIPPRQLLQHSPHLLPQLVQHTSLTQNDPQQGHIMRHLKRHKKTPMRIIDIFVPQFFAEMPFFHNLRSSAPCFIHPASYQTAPPMTRNKATFPPPSAHRASIGRAGLQSRPC